MKFNPLAGHRHSRGSGGQGSRHDRPPLDCGAPDAGPGERADASVYDYVSLKHLLRYMGEAVFR